MNDPHLYRKCTELSAALLLAISLNSCGGEADNTQSKNADTGREGTKKLEAAGAVGYDGQALRKSVDKMLDKRDQQNADLEDAQNQSDE